MRRGRIKGKSVLEEGLALQIRAEKLPVPEREYPFACIHAGGPGEGRRQRIKAAGLRDWRFDFAWPEFMLAVECEGGGNVNGRHNRPEGFAADMRKYSQAMKLGWTVYRCDWNLIKSGEAIEVIGELILRAIKHGSHTRDL